MLGVRTRLHRRDWLRLGAIGPMGLALPQLLRADTKPAKAKACIMLFLHGGQSHIDTFDMKPDAPLSLRGEFSPIATRVPGYRICEHLPKLAAMADRYTVIRSMSHKATNHNPACYNALTGVPPARDVVTVSTGPDDYPHPGSIIAKCRPTTKPVPSFVQLSPSIVGDALNQMAGQSAGFLGPQYDPLRITADPNEPGFRVDELALSPDIDAKRFARRKALLQTAEAEFPLIREAPELDKMDRFYKRAFELVSSPETKLAFDLDREKETLRDRYGRFTHGQGLILARRLVEAGVRLVTVYWGGLLNAPDDYWDTHKKNFTKQKETLLPRFDQCFSALVGDLQERGMLDETLVIAAGEFGRTPKIGTAPFNAGTDASGRDHWPFCYHVLVAGGGVRPGQQYGGSDASAAYPTEKPVGPEDLIATAYHALGIDPETEMHDRLGRPLPVTRGTPIRELF